MKIIQTLLVLLGGLFPFILNAGTTEDIYFSHIGMEDGLSHSTIFAINQDKEGNLWFATYDGVNKYDGYNFTVYRHEYANPNSIASDITRCMAYPFIIVVKTHSPITTIRRMASMSPSTALLPLKRTG